MFGGRSSFCLHAHDCPSIRQLARDAVVEVPHSTPIRLTRDVVDTIHAWQQLRNITGTSEPPQRTMLLEQADSSADTAAASVCAGSSVAAAAATLPSSSSACTRAPVDICAWLQTRLACLPDALCASRFLELYAHTDRCSPCAMLGDGCSLARIQRERQLAHRELLQRILPQMVRLTAEQRVALAREELAAPYRAQQRHQTLLRCVLKLPHTSSAWARLEQAYTQRLASSSSSFSSLAGAFLLLLGAGLTASVVQETAEHLIERSSQGQCWPARRSRVCYHSEHIVRNKNTVYKRYRISHPANAADCDARHREVVAKFARAREQQRREGAQPKVQPPQRWCDPTMLLLRCVQWPSERGSLAWRVLDALLSANLQHQLRLREQRVRACEPALLPLPTVAAIPLGHNYEEANPIAALFSAIATIPDPQPMQEEDPHAAAAAPVEQRQFPGPRMQASRIPALSDVQCDTLIALLLQHGVVADERGRSLLWHLVHSQHEQRLASLLAGPLLLPLMHSDWARGHPTCPARCCQEYMTHSSPPDAAGVAAAAEVRAASPTQLLAFAALLHELPRCWTDSHNYVVGTDAQRELALRILHLLRAHHEHMQQQLQSQLEAHLVRDLAHMVADYLHSKSALPSAEPLVAGLHSGPGSGSVEVKTHQAYSMRLAK